MTGKILVPGGDGGFIKNIELESGPYFTALPPKLRHTDVTTPTNIIDFSTAAVMSASDYENLANKEHGTVERKNYPAVDLVRVLVLCENISQVIATVRFFDLDEIADRIGYLKALEDELEVDEKPMSFHSLKNFTNSIIKTSRYGIPQIGVNTDGLIQAEWHFDDTKHLAMRFLEEDIIQFAAIFSNETQENINGKISTKKLNSILELVFE